MLIKRYLDSGSGLCNYLQFHADVTRVGGAQTSVGGAQTVGGGAQTTRSTEESSTLLSPVRFRISGRKVVSISCPALIRLN